MAEAAFRWKVRTYVVGIDAFVKLCNEVGFFCFLVLFGRRWQKLLFGGRYVGVHIG
jgi:hypothetical protein